MSVIRIKKAREKPYVILDTTALNDVRLSFRAKGLHTYLMAKPDDWQVHIEQLEKQSPREARDAIRGAMQELETGGYIRRQRVRGEKGRMMGWDTTIYETPLLARLDAEDQRLGGEVIGLASDDPLITDYPKSDEPTSVEPTSDCPKSAPPKSAPPKSANPQLLINDSTQYGVLPSIDSTTPPTPSKGDSSQETPPKKSKRKKISHERPQHAPESYDAFYAPYPKHKNPEDSIKAWDERKPDDTLQALIIKNVTARARGDPEWLKDGGKYVPYPATYLRNARWKDEWKPAQHIGKLVE